MNGPLSSVGWLLVLALGGCGPGDEVSLTSEVVVSDSAGLRLVEIVGPLEGVPAPEWRLDRMFSTSQSDVEFFRVTSGRIIGSDHIAVGDDGNSEIVILDRRGEVLRRVGREGAGPGEFLAITSLHAREAGFAVYDARLGRWTTFDTAGTVGATEPMASPNSVVDLAPLAVGESGQLLAIYGAVRRFARDGVRRDTTPLLRFSPTGSEVDTVRFLASDEWAYSEAGGIVARVLVGFGRSLASFGRDGFAVLGDTDRLAISLYDADAFEIMRIRGGAGPMPTTEADRERWRALNAQRLNSGNADDLPDRVREAPVNEMYPAFDDVAVDDERRVWVGTAARIDANERLWVVFEPSGSALARVALPARGEVLDIAQGLILIRNTDEMGVQSVSLYALAPS